MRFRPRSHPYGVLAEQADDPSLVDDGLVSSRFLGLGGTSGRVLPHCFPTGEEQPEEEEDTENFGVSGGGGGSGSFKNGSHNDGDEERDDDSNQDNDVSFANADPFGLCLSPSHPCNRNRSSNRSNHNQRANRRLASPAERSRRLDRLLVSTGRYLQWPLCPFHDPKGWDVLREELAAGLLADDDESDDDEIDDESADVDGGEIADEDEDSIESEKEDFAINEGGGGGKKMIGTIGRKRARLGGGTRRTFGPLWSGGTTRPASWMVHVDGGSGGNGSKGGSHGSTRRGLCPDVGPGTEPPCLLLRQDPDLPAPMMMPSSSTVAVGGGEEEAEIAAVASVGAAAVVGAASPRLLSVLPSIQRMASSGGWGPPPRAACTCTSTLPTSIFEDVDSTAAASSPSAGRMLKPPFRLAPSVIVAEEDRIEQYDADLCRNCARVDEQDANHIGGDGAEDVVEDAAADAGTTPACFSEEWLRRSKRKWKMQRAIRESNRIVEEQRLLPLKEAGLTSATLLSPSRLDARMCIDATLPTKDCPPTGHLQAQAAADQLDRGIVEHIKENFAPSSFLESEVMAQYRDEIEQDKKQNPHERLLDMLSSAGVAKDATRMARPPCTLISQIGNKGNGDDGSNPAITDIPPNDYSYLPTLIRKDPPLPGAEDRQQQPPPPQTHLPSTMTTIKSILPLHAQMPSMRTVRSKDADSMDDEQPPRSLEDIVSKARVIDGRSVGQIMLGSRSHDQGGILIPQQPFPSAAASNGLGSEAMGARQKSTAEEDADLAASVRSFLSKTREADRFVAGSSLSMKANDYECRSWFVDRNNPLPEYGENQALDAEEVRTIFQDRAFCRNREEGTREMVLTGAKMKRERGCCTYRGFLTNIAVNQRHFAARYFAMVQYSTSLKQASAQQAGASGADEDEGDDLAAVPSFLVLPSTSPMISADAPCTTSEAALRIFHRSLARTNMKNIIDWNESGRFHPEPQTLLLRNRRHPNMADSARRSKKLSSLGLSAGSTKSRTRPFINSRKRAADDSVGGGISFHDVFVVKQRKGVAFLPTVTEGRLISLVPPTSTVLCTLGSIEELGKQSIGICGELSHLQNKAAEVAKEEEAYWKEMSVVGGARRADTASRLTFSPKPRATSDPAASRTSTIPSAQSSRDVSAQAKSGGTVLKPSTNVMGHEMQHPKPLESENSTSMKRPSETKAERRERKKQKKERKREKKARKRERKERRRREKENDVAPPPEAEALAGGEDAYCSSKDSSDAKTTRSDIVEQTPSPNLTSASNRPQVASTSTAKHVGRAFDAGSAPLAPPPPPLGPNAIAAMSLGFTPKPPSASRLPRPPSNNRAMARLGSGLGRRMTMAGCPSAGASKGGSADRRVLHYSEPIAGKNANGGSSSAAVAAAPKYGLDAPPQPCPQAGDQPIRYLVSESFFETFGEVVADLSTGQYARGFYEEPEQGIASMELAGEGWGNMHSLGASRSRKSVPTDQVRSVLLYDSSLIDDQQVDLELPGRAAIVAVRLSSWSSSAPGQPPHEAKSFIRRLVNVAALGRYETIHVVLCADVDPSPSVLSGICLLQCALSIDGVKTTYHHVTNKTIAPAIANLALYAHDRHGSEVSDTEFIEDVSSDEPLLERVRFLLSVCSSLSTMQAFALARSPRPLCHVLFDIVGGREGGGPTSFQMGKVMTASLNGG